MDTTDLGALTGSVVMPDGAPVRAATITVITGAGAQVARVTVAEDGTFAVPDLAPGSYTVIAAAAGYAPNAQPVRSRGGPLALGRIPLNVENGHTGLDAGADGAGTADPAPLPPASPAPADAAILAEGLEKHFGQVRALRGIDLAVPRGAVLGVLGPNGAGKTTAVKILTTLLRPDGGRAVIEGYDVVHQPGAVRRAIGLAGQSAAIQEELTGRENLEIVGQLYHLGKKVARRRAWELLERFELTEAANRPAKTFSGGMQRRLDLAASLVAEPSVLFLDEPTTGLDPRSRQGMWEVIRELTAQGTTLLLTTQYLEEADELADEIAVIDHGLVIAAGTAEALKDRVGGDVLEFGVTETTRLTEAAGTVADLSDAEPQVDQESGQVSLPVGTAGSQVLVEAVRRLDSLGIEPAGMGLRRPSLDDVFLTLTGHAAEEADEAGEAKSKRGKGRHRGADDPATESGESR
jgi:ABC-2 type transport system ATP-binding protein